MNHCQMSRRFVTVMISCLLLILSSHAQNPENQIEGVLQSSYQLSYLVQFPAGYEANPTEKYPVILFLHGSGERGDSIELVKAWGPPRIAEDKGLPFIVVSPQCPKDTRWIALLLPLRDLLEEIIHKYPVDTTRIYLTGLSMGGFGTFALAQAYPEYFAAIAPVCGGGTPGMVKFSKNLPTWVFHGDADSVVVPENSKLMVEALKKAGAEVKFTLYPGIDHFSWIPAYSDSGLFDWFLEHRKQYD